MMINLSCGRKLAITVVIVRISSGPIEDIKRFNIEDIEWFT